MLTQIIRNTLNTMLYCRVQIEHQHFFIVPSFRCNHHLLGCLSVSDKEQSSVQCCCVSLCTQQSQSPGKFFSHWDAQISIGFYTVMFTSTVITSYCTRLQTWQNQRTRIVTGVGEPRGADHYKPLLAFYCCLHTLALLQPRQ